MIAIFSALEQEIKDLKKCILNGTNTTSSVSLKSPICAGKYSNKECLLALTGIGKEATIRNVRFVFDNFPISIVISTGFGGALNGRSSAGDIIVHQSLLCHYARDSATMPDSMNASVIGKELHCNAELISASTKSFEGSRMHSFIGKSITVSRLCATPMQKRELGKKFLVDIADMESYWIGQMALERRLPFLAVRSIFDTVVDDLSYLDQITHSGKINTGKALGYLMTHPGQITGFVGHYHNAKKARKNLAIFMKKLIEQI